MLNRTFADGTALVKSRERLQRAVNKVSSWIKKWWIEISETKSTYIDFTNKNTDERTTSVDSEQLKFVNTSKYLGMNFDIKLRSDHMKKWRNSTSNSEIWTWKTFYGGNIRQSTSVETDLTTSLEIWHPYFVMRQNKVHWLYPNFSEKRAT